MVGATAVEILRKALEEGMLTLRMSGLEKIRCGVTTVEEVLRETAPFASGVTPRTRVSDPEEGSSGRQPANRGSARDDRRGGRGDRRPGASGEGVEGSRAALSQRVEHDRGARPPLREAETVISDDKPDLLAVRLAKANAEIDTLRQRLFELNCSDILVVQLANGKAEIEALRERLFELNSHRIAYERLLGEPSRPPMQNA